MPCMGVSLSWLKYVKVWQMVGMEHRKTVVTLLTLLLIHTSSALLFRGTDELGECLWSCRSDVDASPSHTVIRSILASMTRHTAVLPPISNKMQRIIFSDLWILGAELNLKQVKVQLSSQTEIVPWLYTYQYKCIQDPVHGYKKSLRYNINNILKSE